MLGRLKARNIEIFRSDLQGEVTCQTDGKNWSFTTEPSADWTPGFFALPADTGNNTGTDTGTRFTERDVTVTTGTTYVLNNNTKKFHYPTCGSVKKIKEKNYGESTESRDALIAKGYSPCGNCHP